MSRFKHAPIPLNGSTTDLAAATEREFNRLDGQLWDGLPYFERTAAEIAAGVTPTSYAYVPEPVIDVRRYGFATAASAATNTTALTNAILMAQQYSPAGASIVLPPGTFNVNPFSIPQFVEIRGAGMRATLLQSASAGVLILAGGVKSNATKYGVAVRNLAVVLSHKDGHALQVMECVGGVFENLYFEGTTTAARTNTGVIIDGGDASAFFNRFDTVICNHFQTGFKFALTGTSFATGQTFTNCTAFGDVGTFATSRGFDLPVAAGIGSQFIGGNFESCGIGAKKS